MLENGRLAFVRYMAAMGLLAAVTGLNILFFAGNGHEVPLLFYCAVIIVSRVYLDRGPSILATALAIGVTLYFYLFSKRSSPITGGDIIRSVAVTAQALLVLYLSNALVVARKKDLAAGERFKRIIEQSSDGIVVVNQEGRRSYCSSSVEQIIGYTAEEFLVQDPWVIGHPDEMPEILTQFGQLARQQGGSLTLVHRMKHKKEHWIWVESRITNLLHDPHVRGMIANFNDVSDRVELDRARSDFIGVVSHELKTPLTSLKAYSQLLVEKLADGPDEESSFFAGKLIDNSNKLIKMLEDMLDVTTINAGRLQLTHVEFDFNSLVLEVIETMQRTTHSNPLTVELTPLVSIYADKVRIGQVLVNLLSNAIKYSPAGGNICIRSERQDNRLFFSIQDCGIGIPLNEQARVFDRLYRVTNANAFKGLGLGLYICKQIIQKHDGEIGVISEEGKGATFWFTVPLATSAAGD